MPSLQSDKLKAVCIWKEKLQVKFNQSILSKVFRDDAVSYCVGCKDGQVHKFDMLLQEDNLVGLKKESTIFETKGGPIHALFANDVTKFGGVDMLVGDSFGTLSIITNGQMLNRTKYSEATIKDILILTDSFDNMTIVVGTNDGMLLGVSPYDVLWKCQVNELTREKPTSLCENKVSVECLQILQTQSGNIDCSYVIVADSQSEIHLFLNGRCVMTLKVPSVVKSMCSGYFINEDSKEKNPSPNKAQRYHSDKQIALATQSGIIYVLSNYVIYPYYSSSYPVTNIKTLPASGLDTFDSILCIGDASKLSFLCEQKCVGCYEASDWIKTINILPHSTLTHSSYVILSCMDDTVHIVKINDR